LIYQRENKDDKGDSIESHRRIRNEKFGKKPL
jgi:hypothetical protein